MTAKLPPLPFNKWDFDITLDFENAVASHQAYALQAVREALERAACTLHPELRSMVSRSDAAAAIRALLKEYSDDRS